MESEQATTVVSIKAVVRSSVKVPEFDKNLKKAGGHIGRNIVEITIKISITLYKNKGNKSDSFNYQGKTALSITVKILARIQLNRARASVASEPIGAE